MVLSTNPRSVPWNCAYITFKDDDIFQQASNAVRTMIISQKIGFSFHVLLELNAMVLDTGNFDN